MKELSKKPLVLSSFNLSISYFQRVLEGINVLFHVLKFILMCEKCVFVISYKEVLIAKHDQNSVAMLEKDLVRRRFLNFYS